MAKSKKVVELQSGAATDTVQVASSSHVKALHVKALGDTSPESLRQPTAHVLAPDMSPNISANWASADEERIQGKWIYLALPLISLHLMAVFAEPLRFFSRSNMQVAPNAELVRNLVRPYSQFLFLDHGYFFFAPNPGPGHLIRILNSPEPVPSLEDDRRLTPLEEAKSLESAGSQVVQLPDRNTHVPRLLYHRYFMLSEFYYSSFAPPELPPDLASDETISTHWKRDRDIYVRLKDSLHRYGKGQTGLAFARVDRIERELPDVKTTLKDKVRISDIRWQFILPESNLLPGPADAARGDRSRMELNSTTPMTGPNSRDRARLPNNRPPIDLPTNSRPQSQSPANVPPPAGGTVQPPIEVLPLPR